MSHLETWTRADIARAADRIAFVEQLTPRELQILRSIADGKTHAEMAAEMSVSATTIKLHAQHVFRKLGARNGASAVDRAYRFGVLNVGAYPREPKGDAGYPQTRSPSAVRPPLPSGAAVGEAKPCPRCPDGHPDPLAKPWVVYVHSDRDGDGKPVYLVVGKSDGSHVSESDAEWLWGLIRAQSPDGPPREPAPAPAWQGRGRTGRAG